MRLSCWIHRHSEVEVSDSSPLVHPMERKRRLQRNPCRSMAGVWKSNWRHRGENNNDDRHQRSSDRLCPQVRMRDWQTRMDDPDGRLGMDPLRSEPRDGRYHDGSHRDNLSSARAFRSQWYPSSERMKVLRARKVGYSRSSYHVLVFWIVIVASRTESCAHSTHSQSSTGPRWARNTSKRQFSSQGGSAQSRSSIADVTGSSVSSGNSDGSIGHSST